MDSLVLVHGLEGNPTETWTHPESKVLWATDLLPKDLPATRVLSFGYNADMYCNNSIAGIRGNAESLISLLEARRLDAPNRPILFVAHCLGGLIVKQLLSFASQNPAQHGTICSATKGILFFGTPNNAVDRRQWETLAKRYSRFERRKSNLAGLVSALTKDATDLSEVNEDFRHISDRWPIFSFYESVAQEGAEAPLLDISVARMFVDNEQGVLVDADHTGMSRVEDEDDETYVNIKLCVYKSLSGRVEEENPAGAAGVGAQDSEKETEKEDSGYEEETPTPPRKKPLMLTYGSQADERQMWKDVIGRSEDGVKGKGKGKVLVPAVRQRSESQPTTQKNVGYQVYESQNDERDRIEEKEKENVKVQVKEQMREQKKEQAKEQVKEPGRTPRKERAPEPISHSQLRTLTSVTGEPVEAQTAYAVEEKEQQDEYVGFDPGPAPKTKKTSLRKKIRSYLKPKAVA